MLRAVLSFQYEAIKRNAGAFCLMVLTALCVLFVGYRHATLKQAVAYLAVMWLCSLFVDMYAIWRPAARDFPVRRPMRETILFFMCVVLAMVFFYFRLFGPTPWTQLKPVYRLAIIPLVGFVYPIGLALIMLLLRYRPADLGIRIRGLILVIPVVLLSAITNRIISPQSLTWDAVMAEGGSLAGVLFSGLIGAGLSEEFFRMVGQTRLGALLRDKGLGWFIITCVWAAMHAPKWYSESHEMMETMFSVVRVVPIGLMWGYMTHRTKSILPATIVHGTNFWGLQNF